MIVNGLGDIMKDRIYFYNKRQYKITEYDKLGDYELSVDDRTPFFFLRQSFPIQTFCVRALAREDKNFILMYR